MDIRFVNLNGALTPYAQASLHINDLGLRRGYGIFDSFRVVRGVPLFLEDHLTRLENSAQQADLTLPFTRAELSYMVQEVLRANHFEDLPTLSIQVIVTGGYTEDAYTPTGKPNFMIVPLEAKIYPAHFYDPGVKLILHEHLREMPAAKTTAYLTAVRVGKRMRAEGASEVLYFEGERVLECARSSLAIINNGVLITAEREVLYGVTRGRVLQVAQRLMPTELRDFTLKELYAADEVFITSTTRGVMAVSQIEDQPVGGGRCGPWTKRLMEAFKEHVETYLATKGVGEKVKSTD